ncbi:hypothetical protein DMJ13_07125 [halophilic archaeon]|nr:hypothetical protein DMJ13_07125 [halophilic archaeon]
MGCSLPMQTIELNLNADVYGDLQDIARESGESNHIYPQQEERIRGILRTFVRANVAEGTHTPEADSSVSAGEYDALAQDLRDAAESLERAKEEADSEDDGSLLDKLSLRDLSPRGDA